MGPTSKGRKGKGGGKGKGREEKEERRGEDGREIGKGREGHVESKKPWARNVANARMHESIAQNNITVNYSYLPFLSIQHGSSCKRPLWNITHDDLAAD